MVRAAGTAGAETPRAGSVTAVAGHLDGIRQCTRGFLGFTVSADRTAGMVLFSVYVDLEDPDAASSAAYAWVVAAVSAAGDDSGGWVLFADPEECEHVLA